MLASSRRNQRGRRGIVLVLVLAVLGLMAVIGITFATFSGQSRISARNFAQSMDQPQRGELMDYALSQLISDTANPLSAIRGHSLARDMYGNDGSSNGYLTSRPGGAALVAPYNYNYFYIQSVTSAGGNLYNLTTNIPQNDPALYGYNSFARWTLRVSYKGALAASVPPNPPYNKWVVTQTLEVLGDNGYSPSSTNPRVLTVNILSSPTSPPYATTDATTSLLNPTLNPPLYPNGYNTQLPGFYLLQAATNSTNLGTTAPFILDGRWLHAFNGPGMGAVVSSLTNVPNSYYGNFRYNAALNPSFTSPPYGPNTAGMDEDYDAVDLENWFLAMQSADGSVIIPSFHRPAAIRIDPANGVDDWLRTNTTTWADSASRILRPVAADGNDASTFPDLRPDSTGRITYDVDNDGDGLTDSVWVDLGYPARRNAQGQLYKPLFAFMVIGLNGRIPLNTAGNLAGGRNGNGAYHASHLGNSVSEVDPTYGLQNGFNYNSNDITAAFFSPVYNSTAQAITFTDANGNVGSNSQVDSGGVDVRLTQLRNLLAGTRPQPNPMPSTISGFPQTSLSWPMVTDPLGATNGDDNFTAYNNGQVYFMPNGVAEATFDILVNNNPNQVARTTNPVPGRWGEAQSVPGNPIPPPSGTTLTDGTVVNLVGSANLPYNNPVRAGYSLDPGDLASGQPRDSADDNYNSFDPYPFGHTGEVGDLDFLDLAGGYLLPVERMRRYVTPADINGTGSIVQWDGTSTSTGNNLGGDQWGRVEFSSYFRPPGLPGQVPPTPPGGPLTTGVTFPWTSMEGYPNTLVTNVTTGALAGTLLNNNNPLHGFEAQRFPNLMYSTTSPYTFTPQRAGGVPVDQNQLSGNLFLPGTLPTYDVKVNSSNNTNSDGLNEADEMNLYQPNAQLDSPFGYGDLEWLYRQQDVDGASLTSRLAQLAPISFTNTVDGQRRRRLYALDTWDLNSYSWTNDNAASVDFPDGFPYNARFVTGANAGFPTLNNPRNPGISNLQDRTLPAPSPAFSLAHRDKKINLNYPLPVSNDPNEAVRQKWISDTYQTLKAILPPRSVDTPEELAQLSQFVINIVDFRDPDCTMTHWQNPDVTMAVWNGNGTGPAPAPVLIMSGVAPQANMALASTATPPVLDQYGMEFNPIAINEVLAYSFSRKYQVNNTVTPPHNTATPRLFIELVNTLTSPATQTSATNNASLLDLSGFQSATAGTDPWSGGCWDIIFTEDNAAARPDPFLGQLQPQPTGNVAFRGLIPLAQPAFNFTGGTATDVVMNALPSTPGTTGLNFFGLNYFMVIGNNLADFAADVTPFENGTPPINFLLNPAYDPVDFNPPGVAPPSLTLDPGVLPPALGATSPTTTYPPKFDSSVPMPVGKGNAKFYWVCLRRPANPFAPVSLTNPMVVVDSMRFPYIEAKGTGAPGTPTDTVTQGTNQLYSYQRIQPYRGGHEVPAASGSGIDTRYGYTEQIAVPATASATQGLFGTTPITITPIYHTLGLPNDGAFTPPPITAAATITQQEEWAYFPFNDRDFTSVAELTLVPGCPPGLFTKQFVELAPSQANSATFIGAVTSPLATPVVAPPGPAAPASASAPFFNASTATNPIVPYTFPYLVDKFFYTAANASATASVSYVNDQTGDGWFKMFEFFEVPSQMIGAVGPVAQGNDFDWLRQDTKPGLINLNLIIDEEVFFSVFGKQNEAFSNATSPLYEQLLSFYQLQPPAGSFQGGSLAAGTLALPLATGSTPIPLVVTATTANGSPAAVYPMSNTGVAAQDPAYPASLLVGNFMKTSFAQFLSLRHGGSGYVLGYGSGYTGQNLSVSLPTANPNNLAPFGIPTDRPFHSLSYPDINYTVMRPAALPPSSFTDPILQTVNATNYTGDPGLKNPFLYVGYQTGQAPVSTATSLVLPPAIPTRRLFQVPDDATAATASAPSNASEQGDAYINNQAPLLVTTNPTTGALPPFLNGSGVKVTPNSGVVNLFWPGTNTPTLKGNTNVTNPCLGTGAGGSGSGIASIDDRQHPYWRSELMQKAMNLTTVRTHQYAVWITIGFFEVKRQGDLWMLGTNPQDAYDVLGPELGDAAGQTTRYRGFFLVDRTKLYGFDDTTPGSFTPAVVYRQMIE